MTGAPPLAAVATPENPQPIEESVLLVSMPFGALERPALSLGLLQGHCRKLNVRCDTRYLSFVFAERIGTADYIWLCGDDVPYTAFAGDWLFTEALYGARRYADEAYVDEVLRRTWQLNHRAVDRLKGMRAEVEPFLDFCIDKVPWGDHTMVGFTSVFQQNIASLALAARIKRAYPDVTIAFGGANWEEVMGVALKAQFPFVDLAFSGEADESFPAVLNARRRGAKVNGINGVTATKPDGTAVQTPSPRVHDLDNAPIPDFDPFFEQLRAIPGTAALRPTMLIETARGCWWGERSHCTFCGLNGATMAFRSKSPDRVLAEITHLRDRHRVRSFNVVDDILDMRYFRSVLPRLADAGLGLDIFWEVKANLTRDHVRLLRNAGVLSIQPGIESLSDHVLNLMRKGTTAFRNIELMKWCREYGVIPYWNLLYGFPGETAADYQETVALMKAIWHLDPPTGCGPIRLDRFSPYHAEPAKFGIVNVRPMAPFAYLYPFDRRTLMDVAYYFDFDYADGRGDADFAAGAIELARTWKEDAARGTLELRTEPDGTLELFDTRGELGAAPRRAVLRGWKAAVYLACDRACSLRTLLDLPDLQREQTTVDEVRGFLDRCVERRLMVYSEPRWLGVAVHTPPRGANPGA